MTEKEKIEKMMKNLDITFEEAQELIQEDKDIDKETIQGVFTLMAHASQNVSDYMDTWMADQYRQQQRQKTAQAGWLKICDVSWRLELRLERKKGLQHFKP